MRLTELQQNTLGVVSRRYKNNPITGKDISTQIGLKDRDSGKEGADMRSIINALRTKGYPICAAGNGYYYAQSQTELFEFISSFQARIEAQQGACDALKRAYANIGMIFPLPTDSDVPVRKVRKGDPEVWRVQSASGRAYDVTIMNSFYDCTCEARRFSRKTDCKHIEKVKHFKRDEIKKEIAAAPTLL
jgi:hypothetical protein